MKGIKYSENLNHESVLTQICHLNLFYQTGMKYTHTHKHTHETQTSTNTGTPPPRTTQASSREFDLNKFQGGSAIGTDRYNGKSSLEDLEELELCFILDQQQL